MAFQGFGKDSGPSAQPAARNPFVPFSRPPPPSSPPFPVSPRSSVGYANLDAPIKRPSSPMAFEHGFIARGSSRSLPNIPNEPSFRWGEMKASSARNYGLQNNQSPPGNRPPAASNNSTVPWGQTAEIHHIQRTSSPYSKSVDKISKNSRIVIESNRSPLVPYQARSPPQASQNTLFVGSQYRDDAVQQQFSSPLWGHRSEFANNNISPASRGGMPLASTTQVPYQSGQTLRTSNAGGPPPKRTRSPPLSALRGPSPENVVYPSDGHRRSLVDYRDLDAPEAMPSTSSAFESTFSDGGPTRPFAQTEKPFSSPTQVSPSKPGNISTGLLQEDMFSASKTVVTYQSGHGSQAKDTDVRIPNPPNPGAFLQNPMSTLDGHKRAPHPQRHGDYSVSGQTNGVEAAENNSVHFPAVKRTKLPLASSSGPVSQEILDSVPEFERESQAKAKRLARFKDELSQPLQSYPTIRNQKVPPKRQHQSAFEKQRFSEDPSMDVTKDLTGSNVFPDNEGMASSSCIVGLCPDMCPEPERVERERKGDLDQYERLGGDRNLTNEFLAVKKYNRTAEREAELIRPMPILQKTMDYLLNLLDQPYDDRFLGLYNFLWDRMRAIRMDLRMQHIFNEEAITMLEQMIRLHIIAMHELCECTKGEGFSEGFDAHLNIEQMNKTSVELFQLYDDHRRKGMEVPSEREFRGYYALLKLDKHPGYKVEPAELSLDLAKMTQEIRQTPEVLFARDVARACRTGNFIAFFRLARKASYLQACLMHAHFSKLRTQALASLHSGLQINQGIPVNCISEWLGMEEEDIGNLLEYYGFVVKDFEEPYMVKENAFTNVDSDFPVNRSKLVEQKRSGMIISDVSCPSLSESYAMEEVKVFQRKKDTKPKPLYLQGTVPANVSEARDQEMFGSDNSMVPKVNISSPKGNLQEHMQKTSFNILSPKGNLQEPMQKASFFSMTPAEKSIGQESQVALSGPLVLDFSHVASEHLQSGFDSVKKPKLDPVFRNSFGRSIENDIISISPLTPEGVEEKTSSDMILESAANTPISRPLFNEGLEDEERITSTMEEDYADEVTTDYFDKELAEAKLKLILRMWKHRAAKKREARKKKQLAANAALNLLSVGPPIWHHEVEPAVPLKQSGKNGMLDIDYVVSERQESLERSWSVLNPSDIVGGILAEKNPDAKCLCWKIVLYSSEETPCGGSVRLQNAATSSAARLWLLSKLLPARSDDYIDLLVSSPELAIWKSWIPGQSGDDLTCCLSVIRSTTFEDPDKTTATAGANSVIFLLSEQISLNFQRDRLHDLVMSLPAGSRLPLLILSGSGKDEAEPSILANDLRLHDLDKFRISMFSITFLKEWKMKKLDGLFSSEHLRGGLEWLASSSPPQIVVHQTKTRELVLAHLNSTLRGLYEMNVHRVGPNDCISAFNEALNSSIKDVASTVHANPTGWPCPEINQLEKSTDEYKAIFWYLPSIEWSSPARTESLLSALNDSQLPIFKDDLSWLSRGVDSGDDIKKHKIYLENTLINYLTETHLMTGVFFAQKEASVMLQKFARLELHNATFYIIVHWVPMFRRIFNWRLMNLTNADVSSTYVLEKREISSQSSEILVNSESEVSTSLPPYIVYPPLDDLVEVSTYSQRLVPPNVENKTLRPLSPVNSAGADVRMSNVNTISMENEEGIDNGTLTSCDHPTTEANNGAQVTPATKATGDANKLSELLEKCNILQQMIDKKLSIYF